MTSGQFRKPSTKEGHKWCAMCDVEKPYPAFNKNKSTSDGHGSYCKPCRVAYNNTPERIARRSEVNRAYVLSDEQKARKAVRDANPTKRAKTAAYHKTRYHKDPEYRLRHRVVSSIRKTLTGHTKTSRTFDMVGYTPHDLKLHLEAIFLPGMTWDNYGKVWHIDHIIPQSKFTPDQIRECWQLPNLWPLWKHLNLAKSNDPDYVLPHDWYETPDYAR